MSLWLERCLTGYFQLMGLTCGWSGSRLGRLLGSSFLVLVLIERAGEVRTYFQREFSDDDGAASGTSFFFAKTVQSVNVGYKLVHALIAGMALVECKQSRRLLEQLPPVRTTSFMYRQLVLEILLNGYIIGLNVYMCRERLELLFECLRMVYSNQAVRARYLQMLLLVDRLDFQLEQLLQRMTEKGRSVDYQSLRTDYAHLAKLTRSLSQLYGLSLLLLNVLCLGDCLIACNVYFMVVYLEVMPASWFIFGQAMYIVMPTLVKIWTLCAACQRCVGKAKYLQSQLKDRPGQTPAERSQIEEFVLQIMQDPIYFNVCGIYELNLQSLAGMFFFILEALVIFLQFVSLVGPSQSMD
ncbi:hypothetical protein KR054_003877 [Drosophila jambulina]|nr:hypothetical protein KR054_003877 [Drosophila jambulina]